MLAQRLKQILKQVRIDIDRNVVGTGYGEMDELATAIRNPSGTRLPDTGEDMGKVGIVLNRDETIQRLHSKWRVAARLVAALCISAAGCWFRVYDALYP